MIPVIEVESLLISSTGELLLVDSDNNALAVRIIGQDGMLATITDEGSGRKALDVNVSGSVIGISRGDKLKYDEMTKDQSLTNGSFVEVYSTTSTGKVFSMVMRFSNNNVDINMIVDGFYVLNALNVLDIYLNYRMDSGSGQLPDFIYTRDNGKELVIQFPGALAFDTSFIIQIQANQSNITMQRGLVVRAVS